MPAAAEPRPLTLSLDELRELAKQFDGELDQMPPVFSAKKINGVPAHKLARAGKEVPVKTARITIHNFELTGHTGDTASFAMHVSAGASAGSLSCRWWARIFCSPHIRNPEATRDHWC